MTDAPQPGVSCCERGTRGVFDLGAPSARYECGKGENGIVTITVDDVSTSLVPSNHPLGFSPVFPPIVKTPHLPYRAEEIGAQSLEVARDSRGEWPIIHSALPLANVRGGANTP